MIDGMKFDSKREATRYKELRLLELAGEIRNLQRQVVIPLIGQHGPLKTTSGRAMRLTVDFSYEDKRANWADPAYRTRQSAAVKAGKARSRWRWGGTQGARA